MLKHPALSQENNGPKLRVVLTRVLSKHEVMIPAEVFSCLFMHRYP